MDDKPLPQSHEAERALLGGLIREPELLDEIRSTLTPDRFHRLDHQNLYGLLLRMRDAGEPIEAFSVAERIGRGGHEDDFGGLSYVMRLPTEAPSTANLMHYADVVRRKALARDVIRTLRMFTADAFSESDDPFGLVDRAGVALSSLTSGEASRDWTAVSEVVDAQVAHVDALFRARADRSGLPTGFDALDTLLAGFHPETLVVLAARPGMGKTVLALNFAVSVAAHFQQLAEQDPEAPVPPVAIFSLEMGRGELVNRLLSKLGEVDGSRLRTGRLEPRDWNGLKAGADKLRELKIYFDDTPGLNVSDLRARARRLAAIHGGVGLIIIDYLQLMQGDDPKAPRQQQVADISRALKILSKELRVPVIALSQLNREIDKRKADDRRPRLSDLRESGAIEQDADVIMFLYRAGYYDKTMDPLDAMKTDLIIAKHRAGATDDVMLYFNGANATFVAAADGAGRGAR